MNALKEYLLESLQKTYIFEMAVSRKDLKKDIDGLIKQILENWCLVKYCTLYDPNNRTKNHWKNELGTHMEAILEKQLKGGDAASKYKLIKDWVIDSLEITTAEKIYLRVKRKFEKENLKLSIDICEACIEELLTVLQLMSNKDNEDGYNKITNYIDSL